MPTAREFRRSASPSAPIPLRNWAADWYAWLALTDYVGTDWASFNILPSWAGPPPGDWTSPQAEVVVQAELDDLVTAAQDERADSLGEIMSQADEFISYFMNLMTSRPTAYPATFRVLNIASLVALFTSMYYKGNIGGRGHRSCARRCCRRSSCRATPRFRAATRPSRI